MQRRFATRRARWIAGLIAALSWVGLAGAGAQAPRFSDTIADLPLLEGLVETPESFAFETDEGRVARVIADGGATAARLASAYGETLPALGWAPAGDAPAVRSGARILVFDRGGERLAIVVSEAAPGRMRAVFDLRPSWAFQTQMQGAAGSGAAQGGSSP